MNKFDQKLDLINADFQQKRDKIFLPILIIFHKLKISANFLSILKILSAIFYILLIKKNLFLALIILIIGGVFLDFFDGPLARYNHQNNDRGKFIDMFSDQLVYVLFIWGLIILNIGHQAILTYNIIIVSALYFLIILNKNENKKSDWIIRPIARTNYYKLSFELLIIFYLFFNLNDNIFSRLTLIYSIIITIHFLFHFFQFSFKSYNKNNN